MNYSLSTIEIKDSFSKIMDIKNILYRYKSQIDMDLTEIESKKERLKYANTYKSKIYSKLTTVFRRQIILDTEEAIHFYSENIDFFEERVAFFFEMMDTIFDLNIDFIPDRLFVCSYFRISADTYSVILNDPRVDISEQLKRQFKNIEEYIISMTTNGLENGTVNGYAWRKLHLKSEYGGNEVKEVSNNNDYKSQAILISTTEDVQKRMNTTYKFPELENNNKNEN